MQEDKLVLERVSLICGLQDSGKSFLMRRMLEHQILGGVSHGRGPVRPRQLSEKRVLIVKLSSPHEAGWDLEVYISWLKRVIQRQLWEGFTCVSFVGAIHPVEYGNMPDIFVTCSRIFKDFKPKVMRVTELAPDQWGRTQGVVKKNEVDALRGEGIIFEQMNATRGCFTERNVNGLVQFFDFD